ncbi:MAG: hypothetical protein JW947_09075 [Sedimentisphaerales bacterium]|nr:hypothetical protein [Sedimentisphaerales bacterium]
MTELELRDKMRERGLNLNEAVTIEEKGLILERTLKLVIPPRDQSDRTSFKNITKFLVEGCKNGKFDGYSIFRQVLDFALEASGPGSKKPAAVFMAIMKKELGYKR